MTVNNIVKKARRALGDTDSTGWTDATLVDYTDQAQKDLCKVSRIYKRTLYLGTLNSVKLYALPSDCFQVDRCEYMGKALDVLSREDSDIRAQPKWLHVIRSDLNMNTIELSHFIDSSNYPGFIQGLYIDDVVEVIPCEPVLGVTSDISSSVIENAFYLGNPLGVFTGMEAEYNEDKYQPFGDITGHKTSGIKQTEPNTKNLGVVVQIRLEKGEDEGLYGFLTRVNRNNAVGTYGPCVDVLSLDTYIKVYYSAMPPAVNSLYDALIIGEIWEKALVHFVVGSARMADNDEGNHTIGIQEMKYYAEEIKKAQKLSARTYTSTNSEIKLTSYRRF